ncbi:hypothetical protein AVEN_64048-1 [Araneus ventricosus]|uniref:Uncharacterized protein n=1 Tax=Araneus ventricosus TaxID=182803 RepID=A0A4Y2IX07_ARAVE|nr:hypothetical protein AVEN_64048-1 [Araneus ventricosus]
MLTESRSYRRKRPREKKKEWCFRSGTQTSKRGEGYDKKHNVKYFCILGSNDEDGKMEFKALSDSVKWFKVRRQKEERGYFSSWTRGQRHSRGQKKINERH